MPDSVTFELDTAAVLAAFRRLPDEIQRRALPACETTANNIAREAEARLRRQLGPNATGATAEGIDVSPLRSGDGYVVVSRRYAEARKNNLPIWIEKGTKQGDPGSHTSAPRPYFYVSGELEVDAHERRVLEAMTDAVQAEGLGE